MCGERKSWGIGALPKFGSAPRVRGTVSNDGYLGHLQRFSPACAGNGEYMTERARAMAVQPRVCGERASCIISSGGLRGSAPRVRGTARIEVRKRDYLRFSPACAGNGGFPPRPGTVKTVQPRVCGERDRMAF